MHSELFDTAWLDYITEFVRMEMSGIFDIQNHDSILNAPINETETMKVICRLQNNKATGIDNVPNEILKIPEILPLLVKLFNTCFENSVIPKDWNSCMIYPILKRGTHIYP